MGKLKKFESDFDDAFGTLHVEKGYIVGSGIICNVI
jgi:hypothetical protein